MEQPQPFTAAELEFMRHALKEISSYKLDGDYGKDQYYLTFSAKGEDVKVYKHKLLDKLRDHHKYAILSSNNQ